MPTTGPSLRRRKPRVMALPPVLAYPYGTPSGTTTEYDEGIDINQTVLNGGAPGGVDGGVQSIDPKRLERDPARAAHRFIPGTSFAPTPFLA